MVFKTDADSLHGVSCESFCQWIVFAIGHYQMVINLIYQCLLFTYFAEANFIVALKCADGTFLYESFFLFGAKTTKFLANHQNCRPIAHSGHTKSISTGYGSRMNYLPTDAKSFPQWRWNLARNAVVSQIMLAVLNRTRPVLRRTMEFPP